MKRILSIIFSAFILCLIPLSIVSGQDKKSEKKIKIVIADGSGTNLVLDTLIKNGTMNDSIKLKNGRVIYIADANEGSKEGPEHVFVTVSSDDKGSKRMMREVTVISSDSLSNRDAGGKEKVYVISSTSDTERDTPGHEKVMTWSSGEGKNNREKVIIINDGNMIHSGENDVITHTSKYRTESDTEKTKYVISKDGMVISVEGTDYEKVKKLVEEIENKLGNPKNAPEKSDRKK